MREGRVARTSCITSWPLAPSPNGLDDRFTFLPLICVTSHHHHLGFPRYVVAPRSPDSKGYNSSRKDELPAMSGRSSVVCHTCTSCAVLTDYSSTTQGAKQTTACTTFKDMNQSAAGATSIIVHPPLYSFPCSTVGQQNERGT